MPSRFTRRIVRQTSCRDPVKLEVIIAELEPDGVTVHLRQKGRRFRLTTTWREIYRMAYQTLIHAARKQKKKKKEIA